MTNLEKLRRAERWRIKPGQKLGNRQLPGEVTNSTEADGWNGDFLVPLDGELWHVRLSDGLGWRHLSVTNAQKKLIPSWYTMCRLKDSFYADDAWVLQFHPPTDVQVNDHPGCLHLWQAIDQEQPTPLICMV